MDSHGDTRSKQCQRQQENQLHSQGGPATRTRARRVQQQAEEPPQQQQQQQVLLSATMPQPPTRSGRLQQPRQARLGRQDPEQAVQHQQQEPLPVNGLQGEIPVAAMGSAGQQDTPATTFTALLWDAVAEPLPEDGPLSGARGGAGPSVMQQTNHASFEEQLPVVQPSGRHQTSRRAADPPAGAGGAPHGRRQAHTETHDGAAPASRVAKPYADPGEPVTIMEAHCRRICQVIRHFKGVEAYCQMVDIGHRRVVGKPLITAESRAASRGEVDAAVKQWMGTVGATQCEAVFSSLLGDEYRYRYKEHHKNEEQQYVNGLPVPRWGDEWWLADLLIAMGAPVNLTAEQVNTQLVPKQGRVYAPKQEAFTRYNLDPKHWSIPLVVPTAAAAADGSYMAGYGASIPITSAATAAAARSAAAAAAVGGKGRFSGQINVAATAGAAAAATAGAAAAAAAATASGGFSGAAAAAAKAVATYAGKAIMSWVPFTSGAAPSQQVPWHPSPPPQQPQQQLLPSLISSTPAALHPAAAAATAADQYLGHVCSQVSWEGMSEDVMAAVQDVLRQVNLLQQQISDPAVIMALAQMLEVYQPQGQFEGNHLQQDSLLHTQRLVPVVLSGALELLGELKQQEDPNQHQQQQQQEEAAATSSALLIYLKEGMLKVTGAVGVMRTVRKALQRLEAQVTPEGAPSHPSDGATAPWVPPQQQTPAGAAAEEPSAVMRGAGAAVGGGGKGRGQLPPQAGARRTAGPVAQQQMQAPGNTGAVLRGGSITTGQPAAISPEVTTGLDLVAAWASGGAASGAVGSSRQAVDRDITPPAGACSSQPTRASGIAAVPDADGAEPALEGALDGGGAAAGGAVAAGASSLWHWPDEDQEGLLGEVNDLIAVLK